MNRKPGDWNCPSCQHLNFSRRDSCQRCSDARPGGGSGGRSEGGDYSSYNRGGDGGGGGGGGGGGSYGFGSSYSSGGGGGGSGGDYGGRSYGGNFGGFGGGSDTGVRPGDWYCPASGCGAHNFASRNNCFSVGIQGRGLSSGGGLPPGYDSTGSTGRGSRGNFGFGSSYNAGGSGGGGGGARQGWKSGDWICGRSGCNEHNFASRMECYRCSAPRESGTAM